MTERIADIAVGQALRQILVVMAKEPVPGRVKTRLCPPLAPGSAARCHEAFVTDTLRRLGFAARGVAAEREIAVGPRGAAPRLESLAESFGWRCVDQGSGDLGDRMKGLLADGVRRGGSIVLVGTDSPDLPVDRLHEAFFALEHHEVVIGPACDGGYYLIGCRGRVPDVFGRGIEWGGPDVFADTLALLQKLGTAPSVLDPWHDVDDWPGLRALAKRLRSAADGVAGPTPEATLRLLDDLARQGFPL